MTDDQATGRVNTVLGPVPTDELGIVAVHEALLSVVPGAEYAYDITIDRAEVFETIAADLDAFKAAGGGTIVDATGMFHGRDVKLLEALSRTTGVHIVASTGQGPEAMLGGYFLTPQTNPPTPWPAEKWHALFGAEVTEGMVVPRVERRGAAGLIAVATTAEGRTPTDTELVKGAARAAAETGTSVSIRAGADAVSDLEVALGEGLPADRVVVSGIDPADTAAALAVATAGAYVSVDSFGSEVSDKERFGLVAALVEAGLAERVLVSVGTIGASFGEPGNDLPYSHLLTEIVPALREQGLGQEQIDQILVSNPAGLLAVRK